MLLNWRKNNGKYEGKVLKIGKENKKTGQVRCLQKLDIINRKEEIYEDN